MSKFDDDLHEEQGDEVLDKVAAGAPLQAKGQDVTPVKPEDDEGTIRQNTVYDVPKKWHKAIKEGTGASFSNYAKLAIREKLMRDGLL